MSFFKENKGEFILEPSTGYGLRQCQLGAVWALKSHFTTSYNEIAALISMPTGSGKTALMMAACFELRLSKVLIIVPSKILRGQVSEQFRGLTVLKQAGCLPIDLAGPSVYEVEYRRKTPEEWDNVLNEHDVIVAHPNSISPYYKNLAAIPSERLDAVFVDEAHHEPAQTWKDLNDYYINLKRVFFTATPFRRDRKRMHAKLVYHYSLERALDGNILRPVNFQGTAVGLHNHLNNQVLIQKAVQVFNEERSRNPTAAMLIRTDRIDEAVRLSESYRTSGINVDTIHSKRSPRVNAELVQKVRDGDLDGLVCVGIASEGLDIPNLKVAVLHATPRSIPYTIQFLGRISRQPEGQEGAATLIANTDEVKGEVSRLYKSDQAWNRLIPDVVDEQMRKARHYRTTQAKESDFQMPELSVFFSALVYETSTDFLFHENFDTKSGSPFQILHTEQLDENSPLIIVTTNDKPLDWASRELLIEDYLDIHILYYTSSASLLFELTTSEIALQSFKSSLITSDLKKIPHGRLYRTLSECNQNDYLMVGMRNAVMRGASQPSYKTIVGKEVQSSVRASEGRVFSTGHALLKIDRENTWGLATKRGRVWAMKRGTAEEFKQWCDQLTQLIQDGPTISSLPGLSFLATSSPVDSIPDLPIAIIPDDLFYRSYTTTIHVSDREPYRNAIPSITPLKLDQDGRLHCTLEIEDYQCDLIMDFSAPQLWTIITDDKIPIRADRNEQDVIEAPLQEIVNNFPPSLVMKDGGIIEGRNRILPNTKIENLPKELWKEKDWQGCNIRSERYSDSPEIGKTPIINQTVELIKPELDLEKDIIILDDGSHEIADLIWLQGSLRRIHFVHCKASGREIPGCRKGDCDILFAQAMRSIHWIFTLSLIDRLKERMQNKSKIVSGNKTIFDTIQGNFRINEWSYNIVLVQPGFKISQVSDPKRRNNNVYELAIPMYERILGGQADMEIWGS